MWRWWRRSFSTELTGRTFPEILEELAEQVGVELPKQRMSEEDLAHLKAQRENRCDGCVTKILHTLLNSPKGQRGQRYLFEKGKCRRTS